MDSKKRVTVPYHDRDIRLKTISNIIDESGFSVEEFIDL